MQTESLYSVFIIYVITWKVKKLAVKPVTTKSFQYPFDLNSLEEEKKKKNCFIHFLYRDKTYREKPVKS